MFVNQLGGVHSCLVSRQRRYPLDLTDAQWALMELLLAPNTGGRPEWHPRRDIVDAILYVVRTGCTWRQLPFDFPPWQTVYWYFTRWEKDKVTEQILAVLRRRARAVQGRAHEPTAGIIESQRSSRLWREAVGSPSSSAAASQSRCA